SFSFFSLHFSRAFKPPGRNKSKTPKARQPVPETRPASQLKAQPNPMRKKTTAKIPTFPPCLAETSTKRLTRPPATRRSTCFAAWNLESRSIPPRASWPSNNAVRNNPASPQTIASTWAQIGPAPIPNGQTQTTTTAVSGRTTCIAVDPTNSNNIYVGTAQGG